MYFNYIVTIFFNPESQPVYAIMTRFCVYDCFEDCAFSALTLLVGRQEGHLKT